jgi:putative IMPACT (imprinted ancient) family translation regulator
LLGFAYFLPQQFFLFFRTQKPPFTLQSPIFSFFTIKAATEGSYKEKGSKFHAFAYPVETEEEVKQLVSVLKKKYFDASHHCFAYQLGADKQKFRAVDDGEPGHSAGDPILGQIKSRNLTIGGLIQAYKSAAEDALQRAVITEQEVMETVALRYPYESTPEVMRLVKGVELLIKDQEFGADCRLKGVLKLRVKKEFTDRLALLRAMGHTIVLE